MSGTSRRPPSRSIHQADPAGLEELEELGDDAIIAQQTAAHAPQPRANVSEESRSVVITDHPRRRDTEPPRTAARAAPAKSSAEATLVIRDRRALDELRTKIERGRLKVSGARPSPIYLWGALGLAAFLLGAVVAFLATDGHSDAGTGAAAVSDRASDHLASPAAAPSGLPARSQPAPPSVRLDELPVEPPRKP